MKINANNESSTKTVYMTYRQATFLSAAIIMFGLISFVAGYLFGKKSVIQEFGKHLARESFSDHVEYAFAQEDLQKADSSQHEDQQHNDVVSTQGHEPEQETNQDELFCANVIGFGGKKAAQAFCNRLKKKGILLLIKTRVSKNAQGKKRVWYQAVTKDFSSKHELEILLDKISKLEHIKKESMQILSRSTKKDTHESQK